MNRLSRERSPYLLQHAGNPVDWYPWGEDAFTRARSENKPIFLSIGYSTCHWCHVMEHESFENASVAALLNEHFVSIKVDREERPDVDRVYMTFVQATTGSGGWPMSVWLTPDLKPFYGGTYFPPTSRWGRPGFVDVLDEIARAWRDNSERIRGSADGITERLRTYQRAAVTVSVPSTAALDRAVAELGATFDHRYGGFGNAPKFPRPAELLFLLREHARRGDAQARDMTLATLDAMALGGMRDHVGGGFHRYSVDAAWRVPHFEKMLYDQAQLVLAYLEAVQVSGNPFYRQVAEDTLQYVMREMTHADGGFYSAEDADSIPPERAGEPDAHKAEGAFYVWTEHEIDALLGEDAPLVKGRFGIEPDGNAPADPQQEFVGKNLLYAAQSIDELAAESGKPRAEIERALGRALSRMFQARLDRPRPHLDDKVLTAWNGLMIAAFARAARVVGVERYLGAAQRAAAFVEKALWDDKVGMLLRRFRDGHAEIEAYAEDYAFLVFGLLELFQADPDSRWLAWAVRLQRRQDELFWDEEGGGWFSTTGRDPSVLLRMKEDHDGAEPSASSISVMNLIVLSHLVDEPQWPARIERTLRLFGDRLEQASRAVPMMAAALSTRAAGLQQVIVTEGEGADALEKALVRRYLPFAVVLKLRPDRQLALATMMPFIRTMSTVGGAAAAYVCRNFTCRQPVTTVEALQAEIDDILSVRDSTR